MKIPSVYTFQSVSFLDLSVKDNKTIATLCFRYKERFDFSLKEIIVGEIIKFDIKITGKFHEVTFLTHGQRTDRDPYVLVSKAQKLIDEIVNES